MILRKLLLIISLVASSLVDQRLEQQSSIFYVNAFINHNKIIFIEGNEIAIGGVDNQVSKLISSQPFKLDQRVIFRIFADENLDLGYIHDVNQKMLAGYNNEVSTQYFLLDTSKIRIDGKSWFNSGLFIRSEDLEKIRKPSSKHYNKQ